MSDSPSKTRASKAAAASGTTPVADAKPGPSESAAIRANASARTRKASTPAQLAPGKPVEKMRSPGTRGTKAPAAVALVSAENQAKPLDDGKKSKETKHAAKKPKLVRDSFTFPAADYALIGALKQRALKAGQEIKKSELLRAGLVALSALSDAALVQALGNIDRLKPGRPAK